MTNEELATRIQAGETEYIEQLWRQIERFVRKEAGRVAEAIERTKGTAVCDFDDLYQSGYFAMMRALDHWRPDAEGSFISYFANCLKTSMAEVGGYRTAKQRKDPSTFARSLDAPLTDDDDTTLGDITPDSNDPIAAIEEAMYIKSMHKAIDSLLSLLPEKAQRIISEHYFDGKSYKEIADNMQLTYSQLNGIKDRAFHTMRTKIFECPEANFFREYVELNTDFSYHVGAKSFNRTHTSEVEYLVLKRDKLEREALMRMPTYDLPNATKEQLELYQETQKLIMEALHYKHKRYARFR